MGEAPEQHRDRCVPFLEPQPSKRRIVTADQRLVRRASVERRVLERVGVLVGIGDSRLRIEPRVGHHHHPLQVEIIEAEHLCDIELLGQGPDILVGVEQAQGTQHGIVGSLLVGRIVARKDALELGRQIGA